MSIQKRVEQMTTQESKLKSKMQALVGQYGAQETLEAVRACMGSAGSYDDVCLHKLRFETNMHRSKILNAWRKVRVNTLGEIRQCKLVHQEHRVYLVNDSLLWIRIPKYGRKLHRHFLQALRTKIGEDKFRCYYLHLDTYGELA